MLLTRFPHKRIQTFAIPLLTLISITSIAHAASANKPWLDAAPTTRITGPVDDSKTITISGSRHPHAIASNDQGAVDSKLRMDRMILLLQPDAQQRAALDALISAQHDPTSPTHHQWLTPAEYAQHFGASASDVRSVTNWLERHGFTVDEVPMGSRTIVFSGTAGQVHEAFSTEIHNYLHRGEHHIANASEVKIPQALSGLVGGVVSLHDFHSHPLHLNSPITPSYTAGSAHYMAPADYHTIYNLKALDTQSINGAGRSIAVLGRSNVSLSDYTTFRNTFGLKGFSYAQIAAGPSPGYVSGDEMESDLDIEWAAAVATGVTIKFVTSASTSTTDGVVLAAQYAVNNNTADIISVSYAQCENTMGTAGLNFFDSLWQQAASQGISVVVGSGDAGAAGCDQPTANTATSGQAVNGWCSSSYSTCVGGTQFADTANPSAYWSAGNDTTYGSALSYIPEVVWNESGLNGGTHLSSTGGGASTFWSKPSWQNVAGVPPDGHRDVPDVSMAAATHDGYLVYSSDNSTRTQSTYAVGGTSAATPAMAGILALASQKAGYRLGNVNPTLYGLAARQAAGGNAYFHLITSGNNSVPGQTGFSASTATPSYNQATGLGSIDGGVLVTHWTDLLPTTATTLTTSAGSVTAGQSLTFTATVSGSSLTGTVQFTDNGANLGSPMTLNNGSAAYTSTTLPAGNHNITAIYSGDPAHQASTSAAVAEIVQAVSSTTISSSTTSLQAGQSLTLTATVSGSSPTGTVQFKDGTNNLGVPVTLNGATATLSTNGLRTAGQHSVTATYSGDSINTAGTSASAATITVTPAGTSTSLSVSPSSPAPNQAVTLTANVSGVSPTGNVNFTDNGANLGTKPLVNGVATLTTPSLVNGTHNLAAAYVGDANNQGSNSQTVVASVGAVGGDADAPTMPQWAAIMMGVLLWLLTVWKQQGRVDLPQGREDSGPRLAI